MKIRGNAAEEWRRGRVRFHFEVLEHFREEQRPAGLFLLRGCALKICSAPFIQRSFRMDFDDLIVERAPTAGAPPHKLDRHFYEGAVMLAYAMHLLRTEPVREVRLHPDGQHARQIDFPDWLLKRGFRRVAVARTPFAGTFEDADGRQIVIHPQAGLSDVTADANGVIIEAECKGGAIETNHPGRLSRLDKSLCEIIGRLMSKPRRGRQVAVMPRTKVTLRRAGMLAPRCAAAGIEIALVGERGEVEDVKA
jgi:hypothetical protein